MDGRIDRLQRRSADDDRVICLGGGGAQQAISIAAQACWDMSGSDTDFLAECVRQGVSVDPGQDFRLDEAESPVAMRIAFSSASPVKIDEGVRRLSAAVSAFSRRSWRPVAGRGGVSGTFRQVEAPVEEKAARWGSSGKPKP